MDEAALIQDARKGDLDAFNRLVLHYQGHAYNVAYRIMGDPASAADATQEAFISAFRSLRRFRGGSFRSWLLRIVTNACYDELRRRKRRPATSFDDLVAEGDDSESDSLEWIPSGDETPESAAQRADLARALQDCLDALAPEFRVVAVLVDVEEYNYKEAAEVVGTPLGTIKSRLARARAELRDCLQGYRELLPAEFRLLDEAT